MDVVEKFGFRATFSSTLDRIVTLTTLCYSFISNTRNNNEIYIYVHIYIYIYIYMNTYIYKVSLL